MGIHGDYSTIEKLKSQNADNLPLLILEAIMPYNENQQIVACSICLSDSNIYVDGAAVAVDCKRCGDYGAPREPIDDFRDGNPSDKVRSLASHLIRKLYTVDQKRAQLSNEFFASLAQRSLPSPAESMDNLLILIAKNLDGSPGNDFSYDFEDTALQSEIGVSTPEDMDWLTEALKNAGLIAGAFGAAFAQVGLSPRGWQRYEALQKTITTAKFAFFARQFNNPDLDIAFNTCLRGAVAETGYELRTVTQRAGLVDAVIEDEIRRCRFLIADLSDDNAGAYWEAGFAEGLGKAVIYICKAKNGDVEKRTHFDANHRHTVRWDLATLDETAKQLKAVIRNTLLGDAKQADE